MSARADVLTVALRVAGGLASLRIPHVVVGSVASSLHGEPRTTQDIDIVVRMRPEQASELETALGEDFSVDAEALADAMRRGRSWNIFYLPDFTRIDLFALPDTPYDHVAFARRQNEIVTEEDERLHIQAAEDVVLRKLAWFRDGGGVSNQQWRDVVQVLRVQRGALDSEYLERWAPELGVVDLLTRAMAEADAMGPIP